MWSNSQSQQTEIVHQPPGSTATPPKINKDETQLKLINFFNYLWSVILSDVTLDREIEAWISRASHFLGFLCREKSSWQPRLRCLEQQYSLIFCMAVRYRLYTKTHQTAGAPSPQIPEINYGHIKWQDRVKT